MPFPRADNETLVVERRFPTGTLLWIAGALATMAAMFFSVAMPDGSLSSLTRTLRPEYMLLIGIGCIFCVLWYSPTLLAYFFGPRSLVIGRDRLQLGGKAVAYGQIVAIKQDVGRDATYVIAKDGTRLKLRWLIWDDGCPWIERLSERSYQPLYDAALKMMEMGSKVDFGRKLGLDRHNLYIKRRKIPLADITDLRFQSGSDNGAEYRDLKVHAKGKLYEVSEAKIQNPHVFMGLIHALLEPAARG